jgi:glutathionylspermidine synthase
MGTPVSRAALANIRSRMIFEHGKLDPQVGDIDVLVPFPLVLPNSEWSVLASSAERLAREALDAERELIDRPDLYRELGLPRPVRRALREYGHAENTVRFMRFDFHPTEEGWRISEVNADVPGGFLESAPLARLMAEHYPGHGPPGDPGAALVEAICRKGDLRQIGLVHETTYTEDWQMMAHLGRLMEARGAEAHLIAPHQVEWSSARATMQTDRRRGPLDAILRYFPAEWLGNRPRPKDWRYFFGGTPTLLANPGTALLIQSKRFPLVWERLRTPLPTWRRLLPETRDPRGVNDPIDWVLKLTMGRTGYGVVIPGVTTKREQDSSWRWARLCPRHWVAQKRFPATSVSDGKFDWFPCVGVYVIEGRAAGAYARVARRPLIRSDANECAVLVPDRFGLTHGSGDAPT